jgi:hypothetical protein
MYFVPEGQHDSSLARSAWESFVFEISSLQIEIGAAPARIKPYPTGRLFWVALSQALRARLRSPRPSGTKAVRPSKGLALS